MIKNILKNKSIKKQIQIFKHLNRILYPNDNLNNTKSYTILHLTIIIYYSDVNSDCYDQGRP